MVLDVFCFVLFSVEHFVVNLFYLIIVMSMLSFLISLLFMQIERHHRCSRKQGIVHSLPYNKEK